MDTTKCKADCMQKLYPLLSSSLTKSQKTGMMHCNHAIRTTYMVVGKYILNEVIKLIKREIKIICSMSHDSILRDNMEAVNHFSWETVWLELLANVPILMQILSALIPNPLSN